MSSNLSSITRLMGYGGTQRELTLVALSEACKDERREYDN
jgi:hypothetical protein